jgi:tetratricopeptide (TPR) repeat protein
VRRTSSLTVNPVRLAEVLERTGRLETALSVHQRALVLLQSGLEPADPEVARAVARLGSVLSCHDGVRLWQSEELPKAERQFLEALDVLTSSLGAEHPVVAHCLSGLGAVRQDMGDLIGGASCQERAITIVERAYGPDHLDVAHVYDKLGYCVGLQGNVDGSRRCHLRALRTLSAALGQGHPDCGWPLSSLGHLLLNAGHDDEALVKEVRDPMALPAWLRAIARR